MKFVQQNLWSKSAHPCLIIFTANSTLDTGAKLIMGAGAALEAKQKAPELPSECGDIVLQRGKNYGFAVVRSPHNQAGKAGVGIFQTKVDWKDFSRLSILHNSCIALLEWARQNPDVNIRMNYPGIGKGGLPREQVEPLLVSLLGELENLTICYK